MEHLWPVLEYADWKPTYETLHRWVQIIGKLRLSKSPSANHSWNSALYVTSRGLTTSAIPLGERNLTVEFDFLNHCLLFQDSLGKEAIIELKNESVASFYKRVKSTLSDMDISITFDEKPNEVMDATPFIEDTVHRSYERLHANRFWQALVRANNIFEVFRTSFVGKSSPVHFFWGSFDLAITRFSGRRAPEHPGGIPHLSDEVVREAYSHEVMSCGFWPGNEQYPHAAFYAYAYPEPENFSNSKIIPTQAFYNQDLKQFILPYSDVRKSADPSATVMSFLESTYQSAANCGLWDRDTLEVSPQLTRLKEQGQSSFDDAAIKQ
jgi:hypothetical protein